MNWVSTRKMPNITANTTSKVSDPAARPRLSEQADLQQRLLVAQLPGDEGDECDDTDHQTGRRQGRTPALLRAFVDAQHEAADGQR